MQMQCCPCSSVTLVVYRNVSPLARLLRAIPRNCAEIEPRKAVTKQSGATQPATARPAQGNVRVSLKCRLHSLDGGMTSTKTKIIKPQPQ